MRLSVNGRLRQHGSTGDMIFTVDEIISYLSGIFTLRPGDLIFTGTPSGVGPVVPGDEIVGEISGIGRVSFRVE
jgi:2-keto-4-pentenoate hydratase/2-oxohepta-3-ene-1,7-dioic acid hydratase in catechol pathway